MYCVCASGRVIFLRSFTPQLLTCGVVMLMMDCFPRELQAWWGVLRLLANHVSLKSMSFFYSVSFESVLHIFSLDSLVG